MDVLFLSCGNGLSLAARLAQEGHTVRTFIFNDNSDTGFGIYDRVNAWRPYVNRSDLVIADDPYFGYKEVRFESAPTQVLGISKLFTLGTRASEHQALLGVTGMGISPNRPDYYLECWWNGRKWCTPFIWVSYHWNLISQTHGPILGPMVTVCKTTQELPQTIFEGLRNLKPIFEKTRYRGPIRLGFDGRRICDIRVGLSYDNIEAVLQGVQQDPLDMLIEIAGGVRSDLDLIDDVYVSVRMQRIDWPTTKDYEIHGLFEANIKHCGLVNVCYKSERYYATQRFGPILKVTARGETSKSAFSRIARTMRNITLEDAIYREDLINLYKSREYPKFANIDRIWKDTKEGAQTLAGGKTK